MISTDLKSYQRGRSIYMNSVVTPPVIKGRPPQTSLLAGIKPDMDILVKLSGESSKKTGIFMSQIVIPEPSIDLCIVGPFMGASYAVMILEALILWGVQNFIFTGWCGAVSGMEIGSIFVPECALRDEGVSMIYSPGVSVSVPDMSLVSFVEKKASESFIKVEKGKIWTTDAPYMETPERITKFRSMGAYAVDMETSAIFTVAEARGKKAVAVHVVSDDVSTMKWKTGFKDNRFKEGRKKACELVYNAATSMSLP